MSNARGREIDNTHLSIDNAEERGFIHRDYIAHCLRWTHVAKYLGQSGRYKSVKILDVGCGKEIPLAKLMYSSRFIPVDGIYVGVDYNNLELPEMFHTGRFPMKLIQRCIFPDGLKSFIDKGAVPAGYDVIVCFEVCEHVEPAGTLAILKGIREHLTDDGVAFISTPCYDAETGAAANHVNEMTHQAFGAMLEAAGLNIDRVFGTFASMKDYRPVMTSAQTEVFEQLKEFYDSNYLATIMAPLFPRQARNCLWEVRRGNVGGKFKYPDLRQMSDPRNSSSELWSKFIEQGC